jgi:hypothetical protein
MDKNISDLVSVAEDFGNIAKKVNQASQERQSNAEECFAYINISIAIEDEILNELNFVSKENIEQRNRNSMVYNSSRILHTILMRQNSLLKKIDSQKKLPKQLVKLIKTKNDHLEKSIRQVISLSQKIIKADNEIILMDHRLLLQKQFQIKSIRELDEITTVSIDDAHKAVIGSSANLKRGLDLVAMIQQVPEFVKAKNTASLKEIQKEAAQGIKTAGEVNASSTAQLEYAHKVMNFTELLFEHSARVRDLARKKHKLFEANLKDLYLMTKCLTENYTAYLGVDKLNGDITSIERKENTVRELVIFSTIMTEEIARLAELNKGMENIIKINQRANQKSVDLTENEIEFYNNIKSKVEAMTETTRYPIEGSARNIENAKKIEKNIADILAQI